MLSTFSLICLLVSTVSALPAAEDLSKDNSSAPTTESSPPLPADGMKKFVPHVLLETTANENTVDQVQFEDIDAPSAEPKLQTPDRCPCARGVFNDPSRPNRPAFGNDGFAGPILWQISSSAENFIANMIGSITNGLLSGLGFNGYISGNRPSSRPSADAVLDTLVGRGAFAQGHGSSPTFNPNTSPSAVNKLQQIINSFIHSPFGGRLISVLHNLITNSAQDMSNNWSQ